MCLDGADLFSQISKNQRSPPPKLSTVERNDSQYWRQSHERGKEREVSSFTLTFSKRAVRSYSLRPLNAEKWAVFLPLGPGQNTPNLACCGRRTKETLWSLLPCSAVWQVSWLNTISLLKFPLCDGHLHFTCWNTTVWAQFIFISGLKQFDFPADFFEPKEKLVCHKTRCHSGFGPPLPNFPLKHRLYHIWWLILFASFLSMFFSITTQYSSIKVKKTAISFQFCRIY